MDVTDARDSLQVLLVDDEPRILSGLRRMLRDRRWQLHTADSGADALERLEATAFDVVISDYRMPGMDGIALLERVRERHPALVRIVLSGDIDETPALRSTAIAHQSVTKPARPEQLVAALERARRLQDMPLDDTLRRAAGRLGSLPSAPSRWASLQQCLTDERATVADVASIVSADVAMTGKVLQLANSSFMGLPRGIIDVEDAVRFIGLETMRTLVMSVEIFRSYGSTGPDAAVIEALSDHALVCSRLAERLVVDDEDRVHASVAGLLQNVGQLIVANCDPEWFQATAERAAREGSTMHDIEPEAFGLTHADIGAYLMTLWGMPQAAVDAVARHHEPLTPGYRTHLTVAEAVRVAHLLAQTDDRLATDPTARQRGEDAESELARAVAPGLLAEARIWAGSGHAPTPQTARAGT